jgi:t-SNARE complex subunit (syntaxin)
MYNINTLQKGAKDDDDDMMMMMIIIITIIIIIIYFLCFSVNPMFSFNDFVRERS